MSARIDVTKMSVEGTHIDVTWSILGTQTRFHSYWLKLLAATDTPYAEVAEHWTDGSNFCAEDNQIQESDRIETAAVVEQGNTMRVTWQDGTVHVFPLERLWTHVFSTDIIEQVPRIRWDARSEFTAFEYAKVMDPGDDTSLFQFLHTFLQYGLAFLHNVPREEDQITIVANRLSTLQRSHLGDTFTLLPRDKSHHLGETPDHIPPHIDLVYKQKPPDIQMLHVLEQAEIGGENVFVDAFTLIEQMEEEDVRLLREIPVWFVAESETVHFRGLHPILVFDGLHRFQGIHYNEYKMIFPVEASNEFYFAFKRLQQLMKRDENTQVIRLPQNSIVLFHNLRTLHGRRAFNGGSRYLTGCFISEDDLKSKYRLIARRADTFDIGRGDPSENTVSEAGPRC